MCRLTIWALAVFVLAAPLAAEAPDAFRLVQPDAGVMFGIEWRRLMASPLGELINKQLATSSAGVPEMMAPLVKSLVNDVDSLVIAAPSSAFGKGTSNPPALIVVKGRFDAAQIRQFLKASGGKTAPETYRSVELQGGGNSNSGPSLFGVLDSSTIVAGDRKLLHAAIDRFRAPNAPQLIGSLVSHAAELSQKYEIWMTADVPADALKDAPPQATQFLGDVKSMEMGLTFADGAGLLVNVRTKSEESAKTLATAVQGLLAMATMGQQQNPEAAELLRKIRIAPEAAKVTISLSIDRAELQKVMEQMRTAATQPAAGRPATRSTTPGSTTAGSPAIQPPPPSSRPSSIRITGLDQGPLEIPIKK